MTCHKCQEPKYKSVLEGALCRAHYIDWLEKTAWLVGEILKQLSGSRQMRLETYPPIYGEPMSIVTMDTTEKRALKAITGAALSTIIFNVSNWIVGSLALFGRGYLSFSH